MSSPTELTIVWRFTKGHEGIKLVIESNGLADPVVFPMSTDYVVAYLVAQQLTTSMAESFTGVILDDPTEEEDGRVTGIMLENVIQKFELENLDPDQLMRFLLQEDGDPKGGLGTPH